MEFKTVKVRGKVVKVNENIMGTNWIHIQDGTGKDGTHDLLVTSSESVKVGTTIVAEEKLLRIKILVQDISTTYYLKIQNPGGIVFQHPEALMTSGLLYSLILVSGHRRREECYPE